MRCFFRSQNTSFFVWNFYVFTQKKILRRTDKQKIIIHGKFMWLKAAAEFTEDKLNKISKKFLYTYWNIWEKSFFLLNLRIKKKLYNKNVERIIRKGWWGWIFFHFMNFFLLRHMKRDNESLKCTDYRLNYDITKWNCFPLRMKIFHPCCLINLHFLFKSSSSFDIPS